MRVCGDFVWSFGSRVPKKRRKAGPWAKPARPLWRRRQATPRGTFYRFEEVRGAKNRPQLDRLVAQRFGAALFPIDDADRRAYLQSRLAQRLHGVDQGACGGDDVLDHAYAPA